MSWQAVEAVLKRSRSSGAARLVLIAIASHAHRDGSSAYPSVDTIQAETNIAERRTVQRALRALEKSGELVVERRGGRSHLMAIGGGVMTPPDDGDAGQGDAPRGGVMTPPSGVVTPQGSRDDALTVTQASPNHPSTVSAEAERSAPSSESGPDATRCRMRHCVRRAGHEGACAA